MISDWLEQNRSEISQGLIRVFALDECHLCAGDICGYGWGDLPSADLAKPVRQERREVEVDNYRDSQTYYGALDCLSGQLILRPYQSANSLSTIDFVKHLQTQSRGTKIVLIWDGASYHRSQEFRDFLDQINSAEQWNVHCLRLAPYAPSENPIENIWGQAKQFLRQMYQRCRSFKFTKQLFELFIKYQLFSVPDLTTYDAFSNMI